MNTSRSSVAFVALLLAAMAFIFITSQTLPLRVASHFGFNGLPNGFMPRAIYTVIMVILVVVLPLLLRFMLSWLAGREGIQLNIPNPEYWLAPERRELTAAYLSLQGKGLGAAIALFLAYIHWLVVKANASVPVFLPEIPFYAGLGTFFVVVFLWVAFLYAHFRRHA